MAHDPDEDDAGYEWHGAFETREDAAAAAFDDAAAHLVREPGETHPNWPQRAVTDAERSSLLVSRCVDVVEVAQYERIEVDVGAIAQCVVDEVEEQLWECGNRVPAEAVPGLIRKLVEWAQEAGLAPKGVRIGDGRLYGLHEARALKEARV